MFCPNVRFIAGVKVGISSKKLQSRRYFKEKPRDHIHQVIYRPKDIIKGNRIKG